MTTLALIIIAVLIFELIIFFHEGGHFISAKLSGVQVNEFALGMGPKLFGFKIGETQYTFRLLPIGGYCAMEAEDEESNNPRAFTNAKIWKRMIIIVAGAFMNIVLGLILMFVIVVQQPSYSSTVVDSFPAKSYSANCGLQENDKIIKVDNYSVYTAQDLSYAIATVSCKDVNGSELQIYKQDCACYLADFYVDTFISKNSSYAEDVISNAEKVVIDYISRINSATSQKEATTLYNECYEEINNLANIKDFSVLEIEVKKERPRYRTDVVVLRNGEEVLLKNVDFFTYMESKDAEKPSVSIDFYVKPIEKSFVSVLKQTTMQTFSAVRMVWDSLVGLLTGQFGLSDVSGPVGAASAITQVASEGLESSFLDAVNNIIHIMMLISVNLGIFNMLPFPALDGGRFVFLLIEGIFKKPVPRKVESIINGAGLAILLIFMLLITFKDIWQLIFK